MLKQLFKSLAILLVALAIIPISNVSAKTVTVNSQTELKDALDDSSITTITLGSDIETTENDNTVNNTINSNNNNNKL